MPKQTDILIIGAGIIGLATAYQLKKSHPELAITILEKEDRVAKHQTGNNSGVIHSGVYYKPGSLKAKNCIQGKQELMQFCDEHNIPYQKTGKVIVATRAEELPRLEEIAKRGTANGIPYLEIIGPEKLRDIEPHVVAIKALWVPECHIINYTQVARKLAELLTQLGCNLIFNEQVVSIHDQIVISNKSEYHAKTLINCGGLFSDRIARQALPHIKTLHQILPFRGEYYMLKEEKRDLAKGLIYPVPDPKFPFLGVHLTRMINGHVEAGPNAVLALAREGYKKSQINLRDCLEYLRYPGFWKMAGRYWRIGAYEIRRSLSKKLFVKDLQKMVPAIEEGDLISGGAGIRAQVVTKDGRVFDDFSIIKEKNMIHVLNAPSPAATASFSIGKHIANQYSIK